MAETVGGTEPCAHTCAFLNGSGFLLEWKFGSMTLVPRDSGPWGQAVPIPRWHTPPQGPPRCAGEEPHLPPSPRLLRPLTCPEPRPLGDWVQGCYPSLPCHMPNLSERCSSPETPGQTSREPVWGRTARVSFPVGWRKAHCWPEGVCSEQNAPRHVSAQRHHVCHFRHATHFKSLQPPPHMGQAALTWTVTAEGKWGGSARSGPLAQGEAALC